MYLRHLEYEDAPLMLEWMHDENVTRYLYTDFKRKTLDDCLKFISSSIDVKDSINMAIAADTDEYMGTVSLKHIDRDAGSAEFAITLRSIAIGKGYSWYGMTEIINLAFTELGLNSIYWCVPEKNIRACNFYDKHRFHKAVDIEETILERYCSVENLRWYSILRGDDYKNETLNRKKIVGCRILQIKTIPTVGAGELSFFESNRDIPFEIKRFYYVSKVPEGIRRGFHAHQLLKQLLFCPYGKIQIALDDGNCREEIVLSDPSIGIIIDSPIWREMLWLEKDSVLCVAASDYYDDKDYIKSYEEYLKYISRDR